jgi:hypothetical protein
MADADPFKVATIKDDECAIFLDCLTPCLVKLSSHSTMHVEWIGEEILHVGGKTLCVRLNPYGREL